MQRQPWRIMLLSVALPRTIYTISEILKSSHNPTTQVMTHNWQQCKHQMNHSGDVWGAGSFLSWFLLLCIKSLLISNNFTGASLKTSIFLHYYLLGDSMDHITNIFFRRIVDCSLDNSEGVFPLPFLKWPSATEKAFLTRFMALERGIDPSSWLQFYIMQDWMPLGPSWPRNF